MRDHDVGRFNGSTYHITAQGYLPWERACIPHHPSTSLDVADVREWFHVALASAVGLHTQAVRCVACLPAGHGDGCLQHQRAVFILDQRPWRSGWKPGIYSYFCLLVIKASVDTVITATTRLLISTPLPFLAFFPPAMCVVRDTVRSTLVSSAVPTCT